MAYRRKRSVFETLSTYAANQKVRNKRSLLTLSIGLAGISLSWLFLEFNLEVVGSHFPLHRLESLQLPRCYTWVPVLEGDLLSRCFALDVQGQMAHTTLL
jgi:hypothetical protein